jgi:HEPN domain-containing protein
MKEEVERWFSRAEHDFKTTKYNFDGKILDAAIFYAQQATEKGLKALLILKKIVLSIFRVQPE